MLILSRKVGEKIVIGDGITVVINQVAGNRVTLGLEAPADVRILRGELRPFAEAKCSAAMSNYPRRKAPGRSEQRDRGFRVDRFVTHSERLTTKSK